MDKIHEKMDKVHEKHTYFCDVRYKRWNIVMQKYI